MEISPGLSVTIEIQSNFEEIQRRSVCNGWKYLIHFGVFVICLMSFCVFIVLPWMEILIGIIYRNECSMNRFIPIYLIIAGVMSSILLVFGIYAVNSWIVILDFDLIFFFRLAVFYLAMDGGF